MNAWRRLRTVWDWSPLLTLPAALLFVGWATATWRHYRQFALEYDAAPVVVRLHDVGVDEWHNLARRTRQQLGGSTLADVPSADALRTVQLFVHGDQRARLDRDLPYSGYEFVKGQLMFADGLRPVKLRYRGDFMVHWAYDKKSIRVKTGTDELFEGMRAFNLIVPKFPELVNNYLGYRLAEQMGLISPRCELVNVCINGENQGLYEFTEQLEEGTLRRWNRMPGDLYSGDLVSKTAWQGTTNRVFEMPQQWEKVAANNHYDLESRAPLERLLRLLARTPDDAAQQELSTLLDMEAFGAFGAYEVLTQTHHFDEYHNWRLFWDPWALTFAPVVWDPIAWAPDMRPEPGTPPQLDIAVARLHFWLHRNADFLAARNRALRDWFTSGKSEQFTREVDWTLQAARRAAALDPNLRPTDEAEVERGMAGFRAFYTDILRTVRLAHVDDAGAVQFTAPDADGWLRLQVTGRTPVTALELRFRDPVPALQDAVLRIRRDGTHVDFPLAGALAVQDSTVQVRAQLLAQLEPVWTYRHNQPLRQRDLRDCPAYYELQLAGLPAGNPLIGVGARRGDALQRCQQVAELAPRELCWLSLPSAAQPLRTPEVWRGEVVVDGVRDVAADVVIEPGTTIRMKAGSSVLLRGKVTAIGTEQQPIRVVPFADDQQPWGTFSLNGARCTGSTLRHCRLRGGSGYKVPLEEYCSMFSIHNCRDVRIEHCRFADNQLYDDLVHAMYAQVVFDHVELVSARADALDCDISEVTVRHSRFVDSGNDGVDLMTTHALVHDCQFLRNGDKGISIGEGTSLVAVRNTFDGCVKAMEAKDGSIAAAGNCEIRHCKRALNAYRKNWRYDAGGDLEVHKSLFAGNTEMPTADAHSRIELVDCQTDKPLLKHFRDGEREVANRAGQRHCSTGSQAAARKPLPFPERLRHIEALAGSVWATVRIDIRGVGRDD